MPRHEMLPSTEGSLDYEKYTPTELRQLIHDRIGATLTAKERRTIQNCNRYQLTNRLRKLDQEGSFPHFMELPPELRVSVYEFLLVHSTGDDKKNTCRRTGDAGVNSSAPHPAVLRASEQIYPEAMPVLYKQNKFSARVRARSRGLWRAQRGLRCTLTVTGAGRSPFHDQDMYGVRFLGQLLESSRTMGLLRSSTHFTIDLDLVPLFAAGRARYVAHASNAIAALCLALNGASKMMELTINVRSRESGLENVNPASILWPLILLRTDITVKFAGIDAIREHLRFNTRVQGYHSERIADIRDFCNKDIASHDWDADGLLGVEIAVGQLKPFGMSLSLLGDIVDQSIQNEERKGDDSL